VSPPEGVTVAVTDHAVERFRQRVGGRSGALDPRPEIAGRVSRAWSEGRVSDEPPPGADPGAARGSVYVRDLVDRGVIFVCRHDRASRELLVVTLWEDERFGAPRVDQRFTDALKEDERALVDPGRRWRERRDGSGSGSGSVG
jgi:hypothetical protein